MTFIVRVPVVECPFLKVEASPSKTCPIPAGRLVYISGDRIVDVVDGAATATKVPVGWLMQKVKDEYTDFPSGYRMRGDQGSTDAFVGDPVGVAMGPGAIYETDQYVDESSNGIDAGTYLYPDDDGKLSDSNADSAANGSTVDGRVALALNSLTAADCTAGKLLLIKALV